MEPNELFIWYILISVILGGLGVGWGVQLRKKHRQKLGTLSLVLIFLAGMLLTLGSAFTAGMKEGQMTIFGALMVVGCLVVGIAALILAIISLAMWKQRPDHLTNGRGSAIASLVLSSLFGVLMVSGIVYGVVQAAARNRPQAGTSASGGEVVTVEEKNFRLKLPQKWVAHRDPASFNENACLVIQRGRPEVYCNFIVEDLAGISGEAVASTIRANLASVAVKCEWRETERKVLNGRDFQLMRATAVMEVGGRSLEIDYEYWLTVSDGYHYQIVFWSGEGEGQLGTEAERVMRGFETLGKAAPVSVPVEDVDLPEWGVTTSLAGAGWRVWKDAAVDTPHSVFQALKAGGAIHVIPMLWDGVAPKHEVVADGLLNRMDIEFPNGVSHPQPWSDEESGARGMDYRAKRVIDGQTFDYRIRIASAGRFSWLVAAWAVEPAAGVMDELAAAVDLVRLRAGTLEAAPESHREVFAAIANRSGLAWYTDGKYAEAYELFSQASALAPANSIMFENRLLALQNLERFDDAYQLLQGVPESIAATLQVEDWRGLMAASAGRMELADGHFGHALSGQKLSEDSALEWIRGWMNAGDPARALVAAEAYYGKHPGSRSGGWLAEVLQENERAGEAVEVLRKLAREYPHQLEHRYDLGEALNKAGQGEEARKVAVELLEGGERNARVHAIIGYSHWNQGQYREAKAAFEEAVAAEPGDPDALAMIDECSSYLGEGSNSILKQVVEPVVLPAALVARLEAVAPEPEAGNSEGRYDKVVRAWHFQPGKTLVQTDERVISIFDRAALRRYNYLRFGFDPTFERIHVNRLEVFGPDGGKVAVGKVEDYYVLDAASDMADDGQTLHVPIPGLVVGGRIEIVVSREHLAAPEQFPIERFFFSRGLPTRVVCSFLTGDPSAVAAKMWNPEGIEEVRTGEWVAWIGKHLPSYQREPYSPELETYKPMLQLAGTAESWAESGRKYLKQIAPQLKSTGDAVVRHAKEVTEGAASEREKVMRLAEDVRDSLSYVAVEFGVRGRIPHPAGETFRKRQGDCKDHALLLKQLLQAAGIRSSLALVNSSWRVDPGQPTVNQFDHMILHVPVLEPQPWVDVTAKSAMPGVLPPWGLWGNHALVLDAEEPRLIEVGPKPDGSAAVLVERTVQPGPEQSLEVVEQVTFDGYYADWMRGRMIDTPERDRLREIQTMLEPYAPLRAERVEWIADGAANDETRGGTKGAARNRTRLEIHYHCPWVSPDEMTLPVAWERYLLELDYHKDRREPFQWILPTHVRSTTRVTGGLKPTAPGLDGSQQGTDGRWSRKVVAGEAGVWKLDFEFEAVPCVVPAGDYDRIRVDRESALIPIRQPVSLEAGGAGLPGAESKSE
ncbi:MAG: tetratricopeptide repeat protein [Verrucomicrobiota bacterium JB025]